MAASQYDVVVVGAGCAGLTAAVALARSGFVVAVVEAAPMPGAGSGLGGVLFAESLATPDVLGADGVEGLAWERRLVERGSFATDGRRLAGTTYRDPDAFHHCYTVLPPLFNNHLAQVALGRGAALLTGTTAESLIRDGGRVIGVATSRGPLYADLVFLAEGDAGHLVSCEGLDRSTDPRDAPAYLYCLQQLVELLPGAIEECFGVGPEQGVAHDVLLRNGPGGRLNARGQVYTNRQSVTLGLVLPAEHLRDYFGGEPSHLLDWLADMPALRPWWRDGRRGAWAARLLRTGGPRDVPYLVVDGLAVGGAAAGLGADFPVQNLSGPACATGLLLARAAVRIRAEGGDFRTEQLLRHYLDPLRQTRYWRDMEFLHRWPGYLRRTRGLFGHDLDLLLDSAAVWARPRRGLARALLGWFRVLGGVGRARWAALWDDLVQLGRTLRLREVTPRPAAARVLLDGALNAFRDLARRPRPRLPPGGTLRVHYAEADGGGMPAVPLLLRRCFGRFRPVLASAGRRLYRNDDTPLAAKWAGAFDLLVRQLNAFDLFALAVLGFLSILGGSLFAAAGRVIAPVRRRDRGAVSPPAEGGTTGVGHRAGEDARPPAARRGDAPDIHIVWEATNPVRRAAAVHTLPHVCPAGVFEARGGPPEAVHVRVHADRCVLCEACWRTHPAVDWGRGAAAGSPPAVFSPVVTRLLQAQDQAGLLRPAVPRCVDPWTEHRDLAHHRDDARHLLDRLDHKLREFDRALARGPATVDRARGDHLDMLARYAHQLATELRVLLRADDMAAGDLVAALAAEAERRVRRAWGGRLAWAAADGHRLRHHHLTGLRRLLRMGSLGHTKAVDTSAALRAEWLSLPPGPRAEDACGKHLLADVAARRYLLESLEISPEPGGPPARAELLAALADDVGAGLCERGDELRAHLAGTDEPPAGRDRPPARAYRRLGPGLLADAGLARTVFDLPGDWATLERRPALAAEREEIRHAERRLASLAAEWVQAPRPPEDATEIATLFARQAAHVLGGKRLLLRTHARLEAGLDAELAIVLLRVWLDYTATLLDEFTVAVRHRLNPREPEGDRPLVEPGGGAPPRTRAEYLAAAAPYTSGEFLLAPVDLLQPRLVPEMAGGEAALPWPPADVDSEATEKSPAAAAGGPAAELLEALEDLRAGVEPRSRGDEDLYLAEALVLEAVGRLTHSDARSLDLETASARLIVSELRRGESALRERCAILRALAEEVAPRLHDRADTTVRHLGREVLELEALKADFRRRLAAAWEVFGAALGHDADVQASCFALAEATAWLKAADAALGRLGWLSRLCQAEDRDEPAARQDVGRRVFARCRAEVRDRLARFDEDLASLRRGYFAPHVRAAALLLAPPELRPVPPPAGVIDGPLRVLVVLEPTPAELPGPPGGGPSVLESYWTLGGSDRAALEQALRLRDAAPDHVRVEVAALGPRRVGQALREVLSLGVAPVRLAVQDREEATTERAAAALAPSGPFDLVLGGDGSPREKRLAVLLADMLGVPWAGHAAALSVAASHAGGSVTLLAATSPARERPLPAAVLLEPGTSLRPFTIDGYLAGLGHGVEAVSV